MRTLMLLLMVSAAMLIGTTTTSAQDKNMLNTNDVLIIKGKIYDVSTGESVGTESINFDKFGDELLIADLDEDGNYLLVFDKAELGFPMRMNFNIEGYEKFSAKKINMKDDFVKLDVALVPDAYYEIPAYNEASRRYISNSVVTTTVFLFE